MKTMKINSTIVRVKEKEVAKHLEVGYKFIPKTEWKKTVRDVK
jgi:hypothetical protein